MPYLIGLLLFVSVALFARELLRPRTNRIARRALNEDGARASDRTLGSPVARILRPFVARWGQRISTILPQNLVAAVDRMLMMADRPWSLGGFLFVWAVSGIASILLFYYVGVKSVELTPLQAVVWGAFFIPIGFVTPYAYLRNRVNRRHKAIVRAMPDAMDLLVTCIEAGLSIDAAFAMVAEKTTGPLAQALTAYLRAVGFGRARREALQEVAERTGVPELLGIARVSQSEQQGDCG
ncbi:MAG: type II secretion system F family protein [Dehalococcoidia bacterium]